MDQKILFSVVDLETLDDAFVIRILNHINNRLASFYSSVLTTEGVVVLLPLALAGLASAARRVVSLCQEFLQQQDGRNRAGGDFTLQLSAPPPLVPKATAVTRMAVSSSSSSASPGATLGQRAEAVSAVSSTAAGVRTPLVAQAAAADLRTGEQNDDDEDESSDSDEVTVNLPGAAHGAAPAGSAELAVEQAAVEASAAAFLEGPSHEHPALPRFFRAAVERELRSYDVLGFRARDAEALPEQVEGLVKAFGSAFLAPSARGVVQASVAKQEGALYARASDSLKLLALLAAARVAVRDQSFGKHSGAMATKYMDAAWMLLVREINSANFSRATLALASAPAAREIFTATAAAMSDGREHLMLSAAYEPLLAAQQAAKLWTPAGRSTGSVSASSSSAAASATQAAANPPATPKKPRNRNKKNKSNNTKAPNSTDSKTVATPAKTPAKDKQ